MRGEGGGRRKGEKEQNKKHQTENAFVKHWRYLSWDENMGQIGAHGSLKRRRAAEIGSMQL
ncbi:MAG: hypothetical protein B6D41_08860 [Chloroflexi bacterium UTCFX4]|nr:MAG: hypothetical protein B6D41_08860 [Chloroflexi bacterium UTCFX4]